MSRELKEILISGELVRETLRGNKHEHELLTREQILEEAGDVKKDGSVAMEDGYVPERDQDVTTKLYVDDEVKLATEIVPAGRVQINLGPADPLDPKSEDVTANLNDFAAVLATEMEHKTDDTDIIKGDRVEINMGPSDPGDPKSPDEKATLNEFAAVLATAMEEKGTGTGGGGGTGDGDLKADGSVGMDEGYIPEEDQDIPTKLYVDDEIKLATEDIPADRVIINMGPTDPSDPKSEDVKANLNDFAAVLATALDEDGQVVSTGGGIGDLLADGTVGMEDGYVPEEDQDIPTKLYVDDEIKIATEDIPADRVQLNLGPVDPSDPKSADVKAGLNDFVATLSTMLTEMKKLSLTTTGSNRMIKDYMPEKGQDVTTKNYVDKYLTIVSSCKYLPTPYDPNTYVDEKSKMLLVGTPGQYFFTAKGAWVWIDKDIKADKYFEAGKANSWYKVFDYEVGTVYGGQVEISLGPNTSASLNDFVASLATEMEGTLKNDGSVPMIDGYEPFTDQEIVNKKYVGDRDEIDGFVGLDDNKKINPVLLPSSISVPRHVYATVEKMLEDASVLLEGDLCLVDGDSDPDLDGEYVVERDTPKDMTEFLALGKNVPKHKHLGTEVNVKFHRQKQSLQYALDNLMDEGAPIGAVAFFPSNSLPVGWLMCDGSGFDAKKYKDLAKVLGGDVLPDYRDQFIRGAGATNPVGNVQRWNTGQARNPFSVDSAGHSHTVNDAGGHSHDIHLTASSNTEDLTNWDRIAAAANGGQRWYANKAAGMSADGNHAHDVHGGDHDHVLSGGDAETRPDNVALVIMIKATTYSGAMSGIMPIRYEGKGLEGQTTVLLNEQAHSQLLVIVDGMFLQGGEYHVFENQVVFERPLGQSETYTIINYATNVADPHHVYSNIAEMLADRFNIKQGEVSLVIDEKTKLENGQYIAIENSPSGISQFRHLGAVNGIVRTDGTVTMDRGYTPHDPLDVATREYVLSEVSDEFVGLTNGLSDMDPDYSPIEDQDVATKVSVEDAIFAEVGERDKVNGYAGVGVNGVIPGNILPPDKSIPRHVFHSLKDMHLAHKILKEGDFILVDGDPIPEHNSEYTVLADNPVKAEQFKNMANMVSIHRHPGSDVDVRTPAGIQTIQYVADNMMAEGAPIGSITHWPEAIPPVGWLICDGATFDPKAYKALAKVLGGTTLPNLVGAFVRGASGLRDALSTEIGATKRPNAQFTSNPAGTHRHSVSTAGNHSHVAANRSYIVGWERNSDAHYLTNDNENQTNHGAQRTSTEGNHLHTLGAEPNHSHNISGGGDSETRPANTALWYIIKAKETQASVGMVPIRYEGMTAVAQTEFQMNEQGNKNLLVMVNGKFIPETEYDVVGDKVIFKTAMTTPESYTIINYSSGTNDPHHIYVLLSDMIADKANIRLGELCFVHGETDANKNGEYLAITNTPAVMTDFTHVGSTLRHHIHTETDLFGVIKQDGSEDMNAGYIPGTDLAVATKSYVDAHVSTGSTIVHHGTGLPDAAIGDDGDLYYEHPPIYLEWTVMSTTPAIPPVPPKTIISGYRRGVVPDVDIGTLIAPPKTHGTALKTLLYNDGKIVLMFNTPHGSASSRAMIGTHIVNAFTWENVTNILIFAIDAVLCPEVATAMLAGTAVKVTLLEGVGVRDTHYKEYLKRGGSWIAHNPLMADGTVLLDGSYIPVEEHGVATKSYVDGRAGASGIIHHGTKYPLGSLGNNGDVYYKYSDASVSDIVFDIVPDTVMVGYASFANLPPKMAWSLKGNTIDIGGKTATVHYPIFEVPDSDPPVMLGWAEDAARKEYIWILPIQDRDPAGDKSLQITEVPNWERIMYATKLVLLRGRPGEATLIPSYRADSGGPAAHALGAVVFSPTVLQRNIIWSAMEFGSGDSRQAIALHTQVTAGRAEGNYDMFMKVAGHWIEHKPLQADGKIALNPTYEPKLDQDVATKKYVDSVAGSLPQSDDRLAIMPAGSGLPNAISDNAFYINEHGDLKFKKDGAHIFDILAAKPTIPPTVDPHISGALWNNAGVLSLSAG